MRAKLLSVILILSVVTGIVKSSEPLRLNSVVFPDQRSVEVLFKGTSRAPAALLKAEVKASAGQTTISLEFLGLHPAVLFGGEISTYVLWAVNPAGQYENLGPVGTLDTEGKVRFSTPLKDFAMMLTAEPLPVVQRPHELVIFLSQPANSKHARNTSFTFDLPEPSFDRFQHDKESIGGLGLLDQTPLPLIQARLVKGLLARFEAVKYQSAAVAQSEQALRQAENLLRGGDRRAGLDAARRSVEFASQALAETWRQLEVQALAAEEARRQAEKQALEKQASDAEAARQKTVTALQESEAARQRAEEARLQAEAERRQADRAREMAESARVQAEAARQQADYARQQAESSRLQAEDAIARSRLEMQALDTQRVKIQEERDALAQRLSGALSRVAATTESVRGYVVSLPDITFDSGQATLKQDAKYSLAKLSGILFLNLDLQLSVEGHTDSTGSLETNMRLSQARAQSVLQFLKEMGVPVERMRSEGFGPEKPVASNDTADGRARNRRVEIILARGVVQQAE